MHSTNSNIGSRYANRKDKKVEAVLRRLFAGTKKIGWSISSL
jgi:hypothetical protein